MCLTKHDISLETPVHFKQQRTHHLHFIPVILAFPKIKMWSAFFPLPKLPKIQGVPRKMINSYECSLLYTVLDFLQFISLKKLLLKYIFYFEINFTITCLSYNIIIIVFGIKKRNKLLKKTF